MDGWDVTLDGARPISLVATVEWSGPHFVVPDAGHDTWMRRGATVSHAPSPFAGGVGPPSDPRVELEPFTSKEGFNFCANANVQFSYFRDMFGGRGARWKKSKRVGGRHGTWNRCVVPKHLVPGRERKDDHPCKRVPPTRMKSKSRNSSLPSFGRPSSPRLVSALGKGTYCYDRYRQKR